MARDITGGINKPLPNNKFGPESASAIDNAESDSHKGSMAHNAAMGAGKGVGKMVDKIGKTPLDLTLSFARGFHNAPKLYGDDTVRPQDKVTGYQSGLKAAGKVTLPCSFSFTR
jgi:hypothetical protein